MILDILFPKKCIGCKKYDEVLCAKCLQTHLSPTLTMMPESFPMRKIFSLGAYGNPFWKRTIESFKFDGIQEIAKPLGSLFAHYIHTLSLETHNTVLVPIPLHRKRILERGFNQSLLIAQEIAIHSHIPVHELLQKKIHTTPQSNQSHEKRFLHIQNAFLPTPQKNAPLVERILLIDDVYTTGATTFHASNLLKQQYGCEILVLTIAHG